MRIELRLFDVIVAVLLHTLFLEKCPVTETEDQVELKNKLRMTNATTVAEPIDCVYSLRVPGYIKYSEQGN